MQPKWRDAVAEEEAKGNAAIANGLVSQARRHFRVADAIRSEIAVEAADVIEHCREELQDGSYAKCNERAEFLLWGKMLPPEALGPRCYDHAAMHVGHSALGNPAWAILDLRNLQRTPS